ncbi:MAG: TnpV protein [Selenomonadaceae bacterium]|nr:TnpV protein [Selenomonadaceae bacterium]
MEEKFCGVWGHLREEYLEANKPELYEMMVEKNELEEYLTGYQLAYSSRAEKMAEKMAAERGVDDNLYKEDSLAWILATEKIQEEVQLALKKEIQQ